MSEKKADLAQAALNDCKSIIGDFGQFRSTRANTPGFQEAAGRFKKVTGVDAFAVFDLIFTRWTASLADVLA